VGCPKLVQTARTTTRFTPKARLFDIVQPPGRIPNRRRVMIPHSATEQLCLPYGHDDTIPERPTGRYFHLRTRPAWDVAVDI
jgi:hypothetical protein